MMWGPVLGASQQQPNAWGPDKVRALAFDVVGEPKDINELAHLFLLMCKTFLCDQDPQAAFKSHAAVMGVLAFVQHEVYRDHVESAAASALV